jgi:putative flippase GtrA
MEKENLSKNESTSESANESKNEGISESANESKTKSLNESKKENKLVKFLKDFNASHKRLCEIIRFVIVGGIATLIDMFVMGVVLYAFNPSLYPNFFNVFYGGGEPSSIATIVGTGTGFVVSLVANYLLSVLFVYEEKGNSKSFKGVVLFVVFSVIGLLINMGGMWLGYDIFGINEWITKIIMTLVVLVYNYITRKLFIFKKTENKTESAKFNEKD